MHQDKIEYNSKLVEEGWEKSEIEVDDWGQISEAGDLGSEMALHFMRLKPTRLKFTTKLHFRNAGGLLCLSLSGGFGQLQLVL